jgi:predicted RNA-binding Zn ribbon-like protein
MEHSQGYLNLRFRTDDWQGGVMEFLCLDFLNSEWYDGRGHLKDRLQIESWRKSFLQRWGFSRGTNLTNPRPGEMKSLLRLRAVLREIVSQLAAGRSPSASCIDNLNAVLRERVAFHVLVKAGRRFDLEVHAVRKNWTWVMVQVAESAAQLLVHADLRRVKVCINGGCRWAFYDQSKGRTRCWCDSRQCGNTERVRRFRRARQGQAETQKRAGRVGLVN